MERALRDRPAFWVDRQTDRERASDGVSRFGAYLRQRRSKFVELDGWYDVPADRAAAAAGLSWETATGPVMAPPYACADERVLSAAVERSPNDGSLVGLVEVAAPWPESLRATRSWRTRPVGSGSWSDWPTEAGRLWIPESDTPELASRNFLTTTARLVFRLDATQIPVIALDRLEDSAAEAVAALAAQLNTVVAPILRALWGPSASRAGSEGRDG